MTCQPYFVGRYGSVAACTTCKQEIADSIAGWAKFALDAVLLGKAFTPTRARLRSKSTSGYTW